MCSINTIGDIAGQTIKRRTGNFFSGITSNTQTQIDNIKSQLGTPGRKGRQDNFGAIGVTEATGSRGIQGNIGIRRNIEIRGNTGLTRSQGVQVVQRNQGDTGSQEPASTQSAGDIANLIFKSASVLTSIITAFGITVLQSQIAAILVERLEWLMGLKQYN